MPNLTAFDLPLYEANARFYAARATLEIELGRLDNAESLLRGALSNINRLPDRRGKPELFRLLNAVRRAQGRTYRPTVETSKPETLRDLNPGQWISYEGTRGRFMGRRNGVSWIAWGSTATKRFSTFARAFYA